MRRTRGFAWYHILFAVPALALAFGVQYFMRKNYPVRQDPEYAMVIKPSFFWADAGPGAESRAARMLAAVGKDGGDPSAGIFGGSERSVAARAVARIKVEKVEDGEEFADLFSPENSDIERIDNPTVTQKARELSNSKTVAKILGKAELKGPEEGGGPNKTMILQRRTPSSASGGDGLNLDPMSAAGAGVDCRTVEYRGDGPVGMSFSNQDWDRVVLQFNQVKADLRGWLLRHRKGFSEKVAAFMQKQLETTRLRRPPVAEQHDLAWRGIGVFVMEGKSPAIHLSPGFIKLTHHQPRRAKFELARLVAQSWAPCEIQKGQGGDAWTPLLSCLGVQESQACAVGSTSEGGWAVSSALAAIVAPPGCVVPAFRAPDLARCLKQVPTPLLVTSLLKPVWKESRR